VNTQSILEKILEEQLKQRTTIEALQKDNMELKREILKNHKLLQNMIAILTVGPLNAEQTQQQDGKIKQRLKRKDTKHMWWDVSIKIYCIYYIYCYIDYIYNNLFFYFYI
jgi:hypothetical protein